MDESVDESPTSQTLLAGEEKTAQLVRSLLEGKEVGSSLYLPGNEIGESNPLDWFVDSAIGEVYENDDIWRRECLDGVYPELMSKRGEREIEIFGVCVLITDQSLVPVHLRMQIAADTDEITWLECRLGEKGREGLIRDSRSCAFKRIYAMNGNPDAIEWYYAVTYGEREP